MNPLGIADDDGVRRDITSISPPNPLIPWFPWAMSPTS